MIYKFQIIGIENTNGLTVSQDDVCNSICSNSKEVYVSSKLSCCRNTNSYYKLELNIMN